MYLIKKVDFDTMENEIGKAISKTSIGIIEGDESDAQRWIDEHKPIFTYKGWDGKQYPYYQKEFIEKL